MKFQKLIAIQFECNKIKKENDNVQFQRPKDFS